MKNSKIDPARIKNFPLDNPKAKIVCQRGVYYVCERHYYWDSTKKAGREDRVYIGRIVDDTFYTTEQYKAKFKRDGSPRIFERPKNRPYRRKATAPKAADQNAQANTGSNPATEASPEPAAESKRPTPAAALNALCVPSQLTTRRIGATAIFDTVARQIGLRQDLINVWGPRAADLILSLAYHWLTTANNACYLFQSWAEGYLLPFDGEASAKDLSDFFTELGSRAGWEKKFFSARIARTDKDEIFSYDATNVATKACGVLDAQYGKSKKGGYRRQIGMSILFAHRTGLPVMYRLFPGNITDVSTIADLLTRYDLLTDNQIVAAVLDRGYFSLENLARCIDKVHRVLIAAKMNISWVAEATEDAMPLLWDARSRLKKHPVWGTTIEKTLTFDDCKSRKVWIHIFRDEAKSNLEYKAFFEDIEEYEAQWKHAAHSTEQERNALSKNGLLKFFETPAAGPGECELQRNYDAINAESRYFGFFASVSTMKCDAQTAIETYSRRDAIEKCFMAGKTDVNMKTVRSYSEATVKGRFIVSFVALCIICEVRRRMRLPLVEFGANGQITKELAPLGSEYTFEEILNTLQTVQALTTRDGKMQMMEVTKRQHEIARRLRCPDVFSGLPAYVAQNQLC